MRSCPFVPVVIGPAPTPPTDLDVLMWARGILLQIYSLEYANTYIDASKTVSITHDAFEATRQLDQEVQPSCRTLIDLYSCRIPSTHSNHQSTKLKRDTQYHETLSYLQLIHSYLSTQRKIWQKRTKENQFVSIHSSDLSRAEDIKEVK